MHSHRLAQQSHFPCLTALEATLHKLDEDRLRYEKIYSNPALPPVRRTSSQSYERPGSRYLNIIVDNNTDVSKVAVARDIDTKIAKLPTPVRSPRSSPLSSPRLGREVATSLLQKNMGLLKAAAIGDLAGLDAMLLQGADMNAVYDATSMSEVLEIDKDIAESQLRRTRVEDPDYVYTVGEWAAMPLEATALILASRGGHVDLVKRLLAEPEINCNKSTKEATNTMRNGQTAMHWACRAGCVEVVRILLVEERMDISTGTQYGFTPFQLAIQQGQLQIVEDFLASPRLDMRMHMLTPDPEQIKMFEKMGFDWEGIKKCDCWATLTVLLCGGGENRLDIVRRCMKDERIRKFFFDPAIQCLIPEAMRGCRVPIMFDHSPAMLALWLESGLNPNDRLPDGSTLLDDVVKRRMVEHVRVLLMHNAESTLLGSTQRAMLLGNAVQLKALAFDETITTTGTEAPGEGDLPALHRAALQGDDDEAVAQVRREIDALGSPQAACNLLDEGKLPAVFYAVELGHFRVARELFEQANGLQKALVDKLIGSACKCGSVAVQGQRSFRVCCTLIESGALEDDISRAGALAFVKPWCSSIVAATCLDQIGHFKELSQLCQSKNDNFYKGVDERVTTAMLEQAARIAADAPTEPVRQDDVGIVPPLRFYRDYKSKSALSFDHESTVAKSFAHLGKSLEVAFEDDVRLLFKGSPAKIVTVAPKSFQRMQNKLLNPAEHGNPSMKRPRCARNVDVLRGCVVVQSVQELEAAFTKLQSTYKIMRVKNTHDPSTNGYKGYRSLLVNFLYEPGVTWGQLMGTEITFDVSDFSRIFMKKTTPIEGNETHLGNLWVDYVEGNNISPSISDLMAIQGLQTVAKDDPNLPVRMIAELQLVLEPYFEGRTVSHLLFKVARCDTGAMEMVRDFYQEYFLKEGRLDEHLLAVRDIVLAARQGRPPPKRVTYNRAASKRIAAEAIGAV